MKITPELAAFVASNRHRYLKELALYLDKPVHKAINEAVLSYLENEPLSGVVIPKQFQSLTQYKVDKIVTGKHECRAYLAQVALDICLKEGFSPSTESDKKLLACMLLIRSTVTCASDTTALMPDSWGLDYKAGLINLMLELVNV